MTDPTFAPAGVANPLPGWYPDPAGSTALRWWNGVGWTADLHAAPSPQPPAADPYASQSYARQGYTAPPFGTFGEQPLSTPARSQSSGLPVLFAALAAVAVLTVGLVAVFLGVDRSPAPQGQLAQRGSVVVPVPVPLNTPAIPVCGSGATNVFQTVPRPPAGYEGQAQIFKAGGTGTWDSPEFTLGGGSVSGSMGQCGSGAYYYLVRSGTAFHQTDKPTASCPSNCADGGWATYGQNPPAGRYHLHVVAPLGTGWTFDLTESVTLPLSLKVTGTKATGTTVDAHGLGSQSSPPFAFSLRPQAGGSRQASGGFACQLACSFYLVPVSRPLDPARDLFHQSSGGESGGMSGPVPADGSYRLEVHTLGSWTFTLQQ